ncbi:MAG TPA: sialidase family protein [Terriglobales bacterium]
MRHLRMAALALALHAGIFAHGQSARTAQPAPMPKGTPATFQCSPAPCVLPPTQASEGGAMVTDTPIVANPVRFEQLLLGSVDFNCTGDSSVGAHLSTDGGSAWSLVSCMPIVQLGKRGYIAIGEPSVGYDSKGNAYASGVYYGGGSYGLVAVQSSTNGSNWNAPVVALTPKGDASFFETHLAVDASPGSPHVGAVYASGVYGGGGRYNQVIVSHSTDGGTTWTQVPVDSVQKYPEEDDFTRLAVGGDGTVYATWQNCTGTKTNGNCPTVRMLFSKSADGGNTWSPPIQTAEVGMPLNWELPNTNPNTAVSNYPPIAVDKSSGTYAGSLYVVMYNYTDNHLKVIMVRSTDGGTTWSKPLPLAPESDTHDQFFPAISVNKAGLVGVSWLDRRNDPNNVNYQAFAAISYDGGQTFGPNWQLTTAFSNPDVNGDYNWMGDYTGNTWVDDKFIAAWMDSSNGTNMQQVVGGVQLK